jgi:aromatic ring hydroxylase
MYSMKKSLLFAAALVAFAAASFAQTKPKTPAAPTPRKQHTYTVTLPANDYQQLVQLASEHKGTILYMPTLTADQKVQYMQQLETYLVQLPKRIKVDSTEVKN